MDPFPAQGPSLKVLSLLPTSTCSSLLEDYSQAAQPVGLKSYNYPGIYIPWELFVTLALLWMVLLTAGLSKSYAL